MSNKFIFSLALVAFVLSVYAGETCAAIGETEGNGFVRFEPSLKKDDSGFKYVVEGRDDPFVPFIKPKVATAKFDPNEIIDEDVELVGMRQFEPGQLTLVAVMFNGNKGMAMVEDVSGKGYVIEEGMLIGRHGVVEDINRDRVLIVETARTRAGKEIKNDVVMSLNKEGE